MHDKRQALKQLDKVQISYAEREGYHFPYNEALWMSGRFKAQRI